MSKKDDLSLHPVGTEGKLQPEDRKETSWLKRWFSKGHCEISNSTGTISLGEGWNDQHQLLFLTVTVMKINCEPLIRTIHSDTVCSLMRAPLNGDHGDSEDGDNHSLAFLITANSGLSQIYWSLLACCLIPELNTIQTQILGVLSEVHCFTVMMSFWSNCIISRVFEPHYVVTAKHVNWQIYTLV